MRVRALDPRLGTVSLRRTLPGSMVSCVFEQINLESESDHGRFGEHSLERICERLILKTICFAEDLKYVDTGLIYEASVRAAV